MVQDISQRAAEEALRRSLLDYGKSHAIVAAVKLGIPDLLAFKRTAADLAEEIGANERALQRFLRALAAIGVTRDLSDGRFALAPAVKVLQRATRRGWRQRHRSRACL